jgi:hypothetical protein
MKVWYYDAGKIEETYNIMFHVHKELKKHNQQQQVTATTTKPRVERGARQKRGETMEQVSATAKRELWRAAKLANGVCIPKQDPPLNIDSQTKIPAVIRDMCLEGTTAQRVPASATGVVSDEDEPFYDYLKVKVNKKVIQQVTKIKNGKC